MEYGEYGIKTVSGVYMATASVTLPSGAKVVIEGTAAEVADLVSKLQSGSPPSSHAPIKRDGPMRLILDLVDAGFFKIPQTLGAVRLALEAKGHFYPTTSLSPLMLRLVRGRQRRRMRSHKRWTYVQ